MKDRDFCYRLKSMREERGLTQAQLEKLSGMPAMVLSHYESGTRKPGLDSIKSLCKGLKCTATELLGL